MDAVEYYYEPGVDYKTEFVQTLDVSGWRWVILFESGDVSLGGHWHPTQAEAEEELRLLLASYEQN